jgi:hypothetical protein
VPLSAGPVVRPSVWIFRRCLLVLTPALSILLPADGWVCSGSLRFCSSSQIRRRGQRAVGAAAGALRDRGLGCVLRPSAAGAEHKPEHRR